MKKSRKYILILLILLIACPSYSADTLSTEDYKVYSAVLEQMNNILSTRFGHFYTSKRIMIDDSTAATGDEEFNFLTSMKPETKQKFSDEAINDLLPKNSNVLIDGSLFKSKGIKVKTHNFRTIWDSLKISINGHHSYIYLFWDTFKERFKNYGGYILISRVGYNKLDTKALILLVYGCGPLCAEYWLVQLKRTNRGWRIEQKHLLGGA